MKVHFIAIGGSAMHNLAIALHRKGDVVTGSDDEIFEPSKSRLDKEGILPIKMGWHPELVTHELDAVILGMHAREDNPELLKAKELGLKIFSYPEYLYEQSKHKTRIVIGGSHGKTTTTAMLLHAINEIGIEVDYMVGAQLEGYDCMVKITENAKFMILEGDEYLSSPIDRRPKFHLYKPHVAILTGIAWDHINVFPTFENYVEQFDLFCSFIMPGGVFVCNEEDAEVRKLGEKYLSELNVKLYRTPKYQVTPEGTILSWQGKEYPLRVFGAHNLQNLIGAMHLAESLSIDNDSFLKAMRAFSGAGKRLEKVVENQHFTMFKDFAHSPSKLKATTRAVKEQFVDRKLIACMELHTFSSLRKDFLKQYDQSMTEADVAIVYFNPEVVKHKKLEPLMEQDVLDGFGGNVLVMSKTDQVLTYIKKEKLMNSTLLMMSSGNFDGIDYSELGQQIIDRL